MDFNFIPSYFEWWHIPVVFLAGMIGEGYAVVVGSGGILIQFVLLSLGLPLPVVIATDIAGCLGSSAGTITASPKHIWSNKKLIWALGTPFFVGGVIGTIFLTKISPIILSYIVIAGLILLLAYMLFNKKSEIQEVHAVTVKAKHLSLWSSFMGPLGIYTNVSGVGGGTFQKIFFTSIVKISVADGIGVSNIIYLPPTIFSFVITAIAGLIAWPYLITLWIGTYIGSHFVTKQVRKIPDLYLRRFLVVLTLLYLVYLIIKIT